jgi:hemolysin III
MIWVAMGWRAVVVALVLLRQALGPAGLAGLVAGGGAVLHLGHRRFHVLDARIKHFHGVCHLFVMAGGAARCVAIRRPRA